jgi:sensor histidine kinase YesM
MELNCNINLISYFIPYYVFYSHNILQLLACLFYIRFLTSLLEITKREKAIYLYCSVTQKLILLGCFLYCSVFFFKENSTIVSIANNYGTFISTLAMFPLLILLIFFKRKDLAVKFVIAGFSAVVIGALVVFYINRSGLYTKFNILAPISIIEFGIFLEMIFFGLALGYKTHKQKIEKENIELQKKETEMAALKAQMNPHFMFNCINSIDAYIQSNDKYNATLYLNKFAKLIRNVLDSSKQNFVTFSKDIETLKLYIELEELRSENKFITKIDINEELMSSDYKVPALIIQPFVENAIIHGLRNKETNDGLLLINISKTNEQIIYSITDNGIGRKASGRINTGKEKSYGMEMSYDRIKLFNKETTPSVTITDLYENENPTGTHILVQLNFV